MKQKYLDLPIDYRLPDVEKNYYLLLSGLVDQADSGLPPEMDRTGTGTYRQFGHNEVLDVSREVPLIAGKKTMVNSIIKELMWFFSGSENIKDLGCGIWDEWADEDGRVHDIYGKNWVNMEDTRLVSYDETAELARCRKAGLKVVTLTPFRDVDGKKKVLLTRRINQIDNIMEALKNNPQSRRILLSGWNPQTADTSSLPACHHTYQFLPQRGKLNMMLYMRSNDVFLGRPFNIMTGYLLMRIFSHFAGIEMGSMQIVSPDAHLYANHLDQAREYIRRIESGKIAVVDNKNIKVDINFDDKEKPEDLKFEDFTVTGYDPLPYISAPVAS